MIDPCAACGPGSSKPPVVVTGVQMDRGKLAGFGRQRNINTQLKMVDMRQNQLSSVMTAWGWAPQSVTFRGNWHHRLTSNQVTTDRSSITTKVKASTNDGDMRQKVIMRCKELSNPISHFILALQGGVVLFFSANLFNNSFFRLFFTIYSEL